MRISGHTAKDIGYTLGTTTQAVRKYFSRIGLVHGSFPPEIEERFLEIYREIDRFQCERLPIDNYMIAADFHSPYHNELYVNRLLMVAHKQGAKKIVIPGDLYDMAFAKFWLSDKKSTIDEEVEKSSPLIHALDYFDEIVLIRGNHEFRISRMTDGKIQARHLLDIFGAAVWKKKFRYSTYDKIEIGNDWLLVHPKAYRQNSASVAKDLAEKFQKNVINAHGHFMAFRYSKCGNYMGIDVGGMFDKNKIDYIAKSTTCHPIWNNGFVMLVDGHPHLFHNKTDWKFWGIYGAEGNK